MEKSTNTSDSSSESSSSDSSSGTNTAPEALETARARPVIPEWGDIENIIAASVAEAITGAKAVQTALNEAVTAINAILAG
jgi:maltose-binding protein MalE